MPEGRPDILVMSEAQRQAYERLLMYDHLREEVSKKIAKKAMRKGAGVFTLFCQRFETKEAMQAFFDTVMVVLDKKLADSGLAITHTHIPTKLFTDWLGDPNGMRNRLVGIKSWDVLTEFLDDTWPQLIAIEKLLPTTPAEPIKLGSLPSTDASFKDYGYTRSVAANAMNDPMAIPPGWIIDYNNG